MKLYDLFTKICDSHTQNIRKYHCVTIFLVHFLLFRGVVKCGLVVVCFKVGALRLGFEAVCEKTQ